MGEVHVIDEIKESKGMAYLGIAFVLGVVVFALMSAGFIG